MTIQPFEVMHKACTVTTAMLLLTYIHLHDIVLQTKVLFMVTLTDSEDLIIPFVEI